MAISAISGGAPAPEPQRVQEQRAAEAREQERAAERTQEAESRRQDRVTLRAEERMERTERTPPDRGDRLQSSEEALSQAKRTYSDMLALSSKAVAAQSKVDVEEAKALMTAAA